MNPAGSLSPGRRAWVCRVDGVLSFAETCPAGMCSAPLVNGGDVVSWFPFSQRF